MSSFNMDLLKDEEMLQKAKQAIWDIGNCFQTANYKNDVSIVLAAYLLHKVAEYNNPFDFSYKKLLSADFGLGTDSSMVIAESIKAEKWEKLIELVKKYPPEVFAVAALKSENNSAFKMNGTEETPESIIKLAQRILAVKPGDRVADLCCGYGSFLYECAKEEPAAEYTGYDINTNSYLIAKVRSCLVNSHINIILRDIFSLDENPPQELFDKIFSNYPFRLPLRNLGGGAKFIEKLSAQFPGFSKATSSDWIFNAMICKLLSESGKAIGIMTNGSTWNSIDTSMRQYFVENGLIESVIALPGRMFEYTAIATSLIVMSKGNQNVRIVDATKVCQQGRRYNEFSAEDIETIVSALDVDSEYSRSIDLDELRKNEYTLSLSRYLKEELSFSNATPFEDVIKSITRGAPCTAKQLDEMVSDSVTTMQYLMLSNIQNGMIDNKLPYLSFIDPKYEKYCLKNNDLILSKNGYPYKVAIAEVHDGQKILANGNLYIIELDLDKVDPYYLKAFFESEQGIAVLKSITVGATIPNIGVDKLKKVEIPIPSLDEQRRIAEKYQTTLDEIAIYKLKMEKALSRLHHIFDEEREG